MRAFGFVVFLVLFTPHVGGLFEIEDDIFAKARAIAIDVETVPGSECWDNSVFLAGMQLCNDLQRNDEARKTIAALLTNCVLEVSGLPVIPCSPDNIDACVLAIKRNEKAERTFQTFAPYADSLCHYMKRQVWIESTKRNMIGLSANVANVADQLNSIHENVQEMSIDFTDELEAQHESVVAGLKKISKSHRTQFEKLTASAHSTFEKQKQYWQQVSDHTTNLQVNLGQIVVNQRELIELQAVLHGNLSAQLIATRSELQLLLENQARSFDEAFSALKTMQEIHDTLHLRQRELMENVTHTEVALHNFTQEQEEKFSATSAGIAVLQDVVIILNDRQVAVLSNLDTTRESVSNFMSFQQKAFDRSLAEMGELRANLTSLASTQDAISTETEDASRALYALQEKQKVAFEGASTRLTSLLQQSQNAEDRITDLTNATLNTLGKAIALDTSILLEFFHVSSLIFYSIATGGVLLITSFDGTSKARLPLLVLFAISFWVEQWTSSAFPTVHYVRKLAITLSLVVFLSSAQLSFFLMPRNWSQGLQLPVVVQDPSQNTGKKEK